LVYGENEAGKSGMLYSLKGGKNTKLKKYSPWKGDFYGGSIVYTLDSGASFLILFSMT